MRQRNSCVAESRLYNRLALSGASGIANLKHGLCLLVALCLVLLTNGIAEADGRLSDEKSPYLLQHADDAIDWHPWAKDALELAKRENKLIFLSIGYSTCHWCHVMTRTTFSDSRIVSVLNGNFVSILVDREERPDIDRHFADVMMAISKPFKPPGIGAMRLWRAASWMIFSLGFDCRTAASPLHWTRIRKVSKAFATPGL